MTFRARDFKKGVETQEKNERVYIVDDLAKQWKKEVHADIRGVKKRWLQECWKCNYGEYQRET